MISAEDRKQIDSRNQVKLSIDVLNASGFHTGQTIRVAAEPGKITLHDGSGDRT